MGYTSSEQVAAVGALPMLETEEGRISNTQAIVRYISGLKAYLGVAGQSAFDKAQVDLWMDMIRSDLSTSSLRNMGQGRGEWTQERLDTARATFLTGLARFEEHLALRTYFVGHSVTLADIAFTATLAMNRSNIMCADAIKGFPNVKRHFDFMTNTTFYQAVMGRSFAPTNKDIPMAESAKTKEEVPAPTPKIEKPELSEAEKVEQEADGAAANWFFEYKTLFVNAPDRNAAIDQLVKEIDAKRFCVYFTKYDKLPSEGNNMIRTNNFLNFFYRGLDGLNKHTLGAFGAYGPEEDHNFMGVWMFKGTEPHAILKESNQGEHFDFQRMDLTKSADVDRLKSFWLNVDMEIPKPVEEGVKPLSARLFK